MGGGLGLSDGRVREGEEDIANMENEGPAVGKKKEDTS